MFVGFFSAKVYRIKWSKKGERLFSVHICVQLYNQHPGECKLVRTSTVKFLSSDQLATFAAWRGREDFAKVGALALRGRPFLGVIERNGSLPVINFALFRRTKRWDEMFINNDALELLERRDF